jgi:thiol:disulfide interchange protein DsbA
MNRREFSLQTLGTLGLGWSLGLPELAHAQGAPIEGTNYKRLDTPVTSNVPAGKVEVLEFFWYGCPHCFHFEPTLEAWVAKLPSDVVFRRVPVVIHENPGAFHARLYYAVDAMGLLPTLHSKIFKAIHVEGLGLDTPEAAADFMAKQGVDKARFMSVLNSFSVQTRTRQARTLVDAYKIDGVPTMAVAGLYTTSVGLNGSEEKTLATVDALIARAHRK